jgi:hypothetical protein
MITASISVLDYAARYRQELLFNRYQARRDQIRKFDGSPAFQPQDGFRGDVLARYQPKGSPLLSGYLLGERVLHGHAAALDVRHGDGRAILIGFRPQWRGQPFGTFSVPFNAALFHGAVAAAKESAP